MRSIPSPRSARLFPVISRCLAKGRRYRGFRLVEFAVVPGRILLIAEASNRRVLSRGVQGLSIRVARAINRVLGRKGRVFADRYAARHLVTARQVQEALRTVLLAGRRRARAMGRRLCSGWVDPCSSAFWFDGWRDRGPRIPRPEGAVEEPRTWLLSRGWRYLGLLASTGPPR